jgi:hypothetical protein
MLIRGIRISLKGHSSCFEYCYLCSLNKYRRIFSILFLFCIALPWQGCQKDGLCDCFKGTGNDITSDRTATAFNTIQLEDKIDLVLTQDTIERITVVAGKHLIDNIETSISNNTLLIRNHNICNFVRSYGRRITVYASVHHLNHFIYKGAGEVRCTNTIQVISADSTIHMESTDASGSVNLTIHARMINARITSGSGDINLCGDAQILDLYGTGFGVFRTENLKCSTIYLTNDGVSNMYVGINPLSTSYLNAQVFNQGNVYCKGHPGKLVKWVRGNGQLVFE